MVGEDNILELSVHDFKENWDMKINLNEVFFGTEYNEMADSIKITRWQRIKKIVKLAKKVTYCNEDVIPALKSWLEVQKTDKYKMRDTYEVGSAGYKRLTKELTLLDRSLREVDR